MKNEIPVELKIAQAFLNLGLEYEVRNNIVLAKENYKKALDYNPNLLFAKMKLQISSKINNSVLAV